MGKNGKNGKVIQFDRNKSAGPWQPMVAIQLSEEAIQSGVSAAFQNNKARVFIKQTTSTGFMIPGPDGQSKPMPIAHLIIVGMGGRKIEFSDVQRIKNELIHEESDAVEIYPAKYRAIDLPQTHIWCLPPGYTLPLGLVKAAPPADPDAELIPGSQIKRADLMFYVVVTQADGEDPMTEVFASEDDAKECYGVNGAEFIPGQYLMYGRVPLEDEGAGWSNAACERRTMIQERIEAAGAAMAAQQAQAGHSPTEEEMRAGIAQKAAEREEHISNAEQAAEESGDEEAKAELAAIRAELVRRGRRVETDGESEQG